MLTLSAATTALVLIDLQEGITAIPVLAPYKGSEVVAAGKALAAQFRAQKAPVVLVNVAFSADGGDLLKAPVDKSLASGSRPANFSELAAGLAQPGDILVTKHQWGAFYGTDLDVQLRRRGVKTIVLGGIATNMGVESTARQAHEHGYEVVLVSDVMTGISEAMHRFAIDNVFPMLSRVVTAADVAIVA